MSASPNQITLDNTSALINALPCGSTGGRSYPDQHPVSGKRAEKQGEKMEN
jgi:hypothetical protein